MGYGGPDPLGRNLRQVSGSDGRTAQDYKNKRESSGHVQSPSGGRFRPGPDLCKWPTEINNLIHPETFCDQGVRGPNF